jgi:hypothetical protein
MNALERADVIRKKQSYFPVEEGSEKKVRALGYSLNREFENLQSLQTFLFETAPINGKTVATHLKKVGPIDFLAVAGIFVRDFDQRLDVMLAMKKYSPTKVETAIRSLESELGVEIRFAAFESSDLKYRIGMYDKLTRDVFDYPHQIVVDKIGIKDELPRR